MSSSSEPDAPESKLPQSTFSTARPGRKRRLSTHHYVYEQSRLQDTQGNISKDTTQWDGQHKAFARPALRLPTGAPALEEGHHALPGTSHNNLSFDEREWAEFWQDVFTSIKQWNEQHQIFARLALRSPARIQDQFASSTSTTVPLAVVTRPDILQAVAAQFAATSETLTHFNEQLKLLNRQREILVRPVQLNVKHRTTLTQARQNEIDTRETHIKLQTIYDLAERVCPTLTENGAQAKYGFLKMYCDAQLELVRLYASVPGALSSIWEAPAENVEGVDGIDVPRWVRNEEEMLKCLVLNWGCERVAGVKQLMIHFRVNARLILREEKAKEVREGDGLEEVTAGGGKVGRDPRDARTVDDDRSALDSDEAVSSGRSSFVTASEGLGEGGKD
ncbi:hypothetical protein LTR70_009315 [Exophiala xenobiotica]|nr:hypothetical protein LTR70_009315 [Exophiala xenobiotica]